MHFSRGDKFRPSYHALGEIRTEFDLKPVLMTTATCPQNIKSRIVDLLHFAHSDEIHTIAVLPDRYDDVD